MAVAVAGDQSAHLRAGSRGGIGIWFPSLDAGRIPVACSPHGAGPYRLPYFWSDMSVRRDGERRNYDAEVLHLDQNMLQAARLPPPDSPPVAHYSPGVRVRVEMWQR